jgi:hypothetical protein
MRAIAFVYRKIIAPAAEGGLKEFICENCSHFADWTPEGEQQLLFTQLYAAFEEKMENLLDEFALSEGMEPGEIAAIVADIADSNDARAVKCVQTLLRGTDYRKFCSIMKSKASELLLAMGDEVRRMEASASAAAATAGTATTNTSVSQTGSKSTVPNQQSYSSTELVAGDKPSISEDSTSTNTRRRYLEEKRREGEDKDTDGAELPAGYVYGSSMRSSSPNAADDGVGVRSRMQQSQDYCAYADSKK